MWRAFYNMIEYNGFDVTQLTISEIDNLCKSIKNQFSGIIYCYTNLINNKKYIGQTTNPLKRHTAHLSSSKIKSLRKDSKTPIHNAIRKYGINNFSYSVVEMKCCSDNRLLQKSLDEKERYYIELLNTTNKHYGYNILSGGLSGQRSGSHPIAVPIDQYTLLGEFITSYPSITDAEKATGVRGIASCFTPTKTRLSAGGFIWVKKGEAISQKSIDKFKKRVVYQYDIDGNYVNTFINTKEAAKSVNGDQSRIMLCATPPCIHVCYGYRWAREKFDRLPLPSAKLQVEVHQYDNKGKYFSSYKTLVDAAKAVNVKSSTHIALCTKECWRKAMGFYWRTYRTEQIEIIYKNGKRTKGT